jgi:uncharacterized membrane protein YphA (DoxX/SURF4 family)
MRISAGHPTGLSLADRPLSSPAVFTTLRLVVVALAIVAGFMTFRTGDLGAKAVWAGRLQAAEAHASGPRGRGHSAPPGA